ncbi:MAG: AI-2E family transporter [Ruminococcus sp.]|nr:AI-2E family transporter [Ruminococcus sp.]
MSEPTKLPTKENWQSSAVKSLWTFLTIAAAILFYHIIQYIGQISTFIGSVLSALSPIFWGLIIAYLLDPVARFYERTVHGLLAEHGITAEKNAKLSRTISALLMLLSAVGFIGLLLWLILPQITTSLSGIVKEMPSQINALMVQLQAKTIFDNGSAFGEYANDALLKSLVFLEDWLVSDLPSQAELIFGYFYTGVKSVFNVVYNLVIGLILSVYITIDRDRLLRQVKQMTYSVFPTPTAARLRRVLSQGNRKFSGAIRGKMLDSLIIGIICFIVLTILNFFPFLEFPYPVLLSVIVGVTNVVPFFGPFVGAFITGVLVLFDNPSMLIPYLLWILVLQQFDCNYLDPHIVGGSIGLRPFWSIFACLLGSGIFGIPGFVIGPPTFAFIYEIISEWSEDRLREKHLEAQFDIPPEEDFEDFAEKNESFTGTLLHEENEEEEAHDKEREQRMQERRDKLRQVIQKRKK